MAIFTMRTFSCLSLGLFALVFSVGNPAARHAAASSTTEPPSEAILVDGPETADMGRIPTSGVASHSRTVTNGTKVPLKLKVARVSCPWVEVKIDHELLEPGESTSITLKAPVLATGLPQSHDVDVEVRPAREDDSRPPSVVHVAVQYSADIDFVVKPEAMWIIVVEGAPVERSLFVRSPSIEAIDIKNIRCSLPQFTVIKQRTFPVPTEHQPPTEEAMSIRFRATFDSPGFYEGRIKFDTSHPDFKPAWIPVQVRVLPRWTSDPDGFAIILAKDDNAPLDRSVRVATRDGSPLPKLSAMIENVDGEPGALAAFSAVAEPDATVDGAIVRLHTDVPKLVGTEGLARVVLSSEDGKFTRNISIAWIRRR